MTLAEAVLKAPASGGRNALVKHLEGGKIGRAAAMAAKCCECMGLYRDGKLDCRISACPLYPWMPYREGR